MIKKILIVKTSSLGDIIQSFPVLNEIKGHLPNCQIDWVVKKNYEKLLESHPLVSSVIVFDIPYLTKFIKQIRKKKYDYLFDLQGNSKSAIVTFFSRSSQKIGFGKKTVREVLNLLVTSHKYNISKKINIQNFYLTLIRKHFNIKNVLNNFAVNLVISKEDHKKITKLTSVNCVDFRIMVAMSSAWRNKELDRGTLLTFLKKLKERHNVFLYFVHGNDREKKICEDFQKHFKNSCIILERMEIPFWQNLISKMDLVLTVDTAALHLAATTNTMTFSIFGPTSYKVFNPQGKHFFFQGKCPYAVNFVKQCPFLRSCPSGSCIKKINVETLWKKFQPCLSELIKSKR